MFIQSGMAAIQVKIPAKPTPTATLASVYRFGPEALIRALPFTAPIKLHLARKFARLFLLQLADYQHMIAQECDRSQVLSQIVREAIHAIKHNGMTPELNKALGRQLRAIWRNHSSRNRCIMSARRLALKALDTCPIADALMMLEIDDQDGIAPCESHLHALVGIALANTGCQLLDAEVLLP